MLALNIGGACLRIRMKKESIVTKKVTGKHSRFPDRRESAVCETE